MVHQESLKLLNIAAQAAAEKFGKDILAFDVSQRLAITDAFLVVTADNERQVGAIVDFIAEQLFKAGQKVKRREGDRENRWVLLDFVDIIVHILHIEEREHYAFERLWRDCPQISLDFGVDAKSESQGDVSSSVAESEFGVD